jgi:PAS domain S-box-containing protein
MKRNKAEDKLVVEDKRFRALIEHSTDIIVLVNLEGTITYINPAVEKVLGFKPEERIGAKGFELVHPDDMKFLTDSFDILARDTSSPVIHGEMHLRHKDGSWRTLEAVGSNLVSNNIVESVIVNYRDITERRKAEEKLHRSDEKYRTILEDIREGYFEVDLAGNFIFFNDTICRVTGYSRDELMGMNSQLYIDEDEFKKVYQAYKNIYTTGEPNKELVWKLRTKDGTTKYIEGSISLLKDSSGNPRGFRGIARDITERMQIEEKLREEEQRFRAFAEQSSDLIILINREGTITYENPAAHILGFNAEERIGSNAFELIHSDDLKLVADSFQTLFSDTNASVQKAEICLRHRDGSWRNFEAIGSNLVHNNIVESIMINLRDITQRKRAENYIRESEEKYRLLADHMKDQVWLMDLDLKWKYISPSLEKLLGYTLDELKHLRLDKVITATSLQAVMDFFSIEMRKALASSSTYKLMRLLEIECRCKDGRILWIESTFSFIRDHNGKPLSILGEGRDITERKQAENILHQTLESLKRAVGTTIQVLMSALESRDPYTAGHQSQSTNLACAIAEELGLCQDKIEGIRMAASIHDIGKLSIPAEILTKPTKLTNLEFSLIKEHARSGYDMLKDVESPWPLAQIVYQHHERMDGTGYPRNLKGDEILMEARILSVADVVDAMASHRPYRASLGIETALEEIEKNKGILYDADVADACLRLFRKKNYQLAIK